MRMSASGPPIPAKVDGASKRAKLSIRTICARNNLAHIMMKNIAPAPVVMNDIRRLRTMILNDWMALRIAPTSISERHPKLCLAKCHVFYKLGRVLMRQRAAEGGVFSHEEVIEITPKRFKVSQLANMATTGCRQAVNLCFTFTTLHPNRFPAPPARGVRCEL